MIPVLEIREKAREWSLREDVVEKDYALGWPLWGIATQIEISTTWIFKGGTCLKKCYFVKAEGQVLKNAQLAL